MNTATERPMKKLFIVGTKADSGKGGISTALTGYLEGLDANGIDYTFIESHDGDKNTLLSWLKALVKIKFFAIRYRSDAVFWFHCGPWLSLFRKFTLALAPRLFGAETLGHIHSPTFNRYIHGNRLTRALLTLSIVPYKKLVALTPWWQEMMKQQGIVKPILVSPNPNSSYSCAIAEQFIKEPRTVDTSPKTITILTMARMVEGKGIETVIEAMSDLPEQYNLIIAGDGEKLDAYKLMAKQSAQSNRIAFTGWVSGSQKNELLKQASIFCLPSTYDSFGMVFIEAMAYDLPVIAYGWGPIKDVVTENVGQCCETVTKSEVSSKIKWVSEHLSLYSGQGPKTVLSHYTPKQVAANIVELLKK